MHLVDNNIFKVLKELYPLGVVRQDAEGK